MALFAFVAFIGLAVITWLAVAQDWKEAEYVTKPAAMVALILFAATGPHPSPWLGGALLLSLLGDIYLMLPANLFMAGLVAFLFAHLAYIADFDATVGWRLFWFVIVAAAAAPLTRRVLRSVTDDAVRAPVAVYIGVLALMVASAIAAGRPVAAAGALLFFASDALIGWDRFVQRLAWARVAIMATYHLGQLGLVLSLRAG